MRQEAINKRKQSQRTACTVGKEEKTSHERAQKETRQKEERQNNTKLTKDLAIQGLELSGNPRQLKELLSWMKILEGNIRQKSAKQVELLEMWMIRQKK